MIGGGIAGLLLSRRLAQHGFEVNQLEAGGTELEQISQILYDAEMAGTRHLGTTEGRFRTLGGSSTRWGGQLLPYTDEVFQPPAGLLSERWPITSAHIGGYYQEIQDIFGMGSLPFTEALLPALGHSPSAFSSDIRVRYSKRAPFSKRNLKRTIGSECLTNSRIHIFTHANTVELQADNGRVTHARALDYKGRSFEFAADHFIVACGTIESSRILLRIRAKPKRTPILHHHDRSGTVEAGQAALLRLVSSTRIRSSSSFVNRQ